MTDQNEPKPVELPPLTEWAVTNMRAGGHRTAYLERTEQLRTALTALAEQTSKVVLLTESQAHDWNRAEQAEAALAEQPRLREEAERERDKHADISGDYKAAMNNWKRREEKQALRAESAERQLAESQAREKRMQRNNMDLRRQMQWMHVSCEPDACHTSGENCTGGAPWQPLDEAALAPPADRAEAQKEAAPVPEAAQS